MSVEVEVNENDLAEMVEQVWMSYLDPEGISPLIPTYDENQPSEVHSSVSITGSWTGHVVYACSSTAAKHAANASNGAVGKRLRTRRIPTRRLAVSSRFANPAVVH